MSFEILNYPDDLERKVLEIFIVESRKEFEIIKLINEGIPPVEKLIKWGAVIIRPLENDVNFDIATKNSRAGDYMVTNLDFTVLKQMDTDHTNIDQFLNKNVVTILKTSINDFLIGSMDEPMKLSYKEDKRKIDVSLSCDSTFGPIRKNRSPF